MEVAYIHLFISIQEEFIQSRAIKIGQSLRICTGIMAFIRNKEIKFFAFQHIDKMPIDFSAFYRRISNAQDTGFIDQPSRPPGHLQHLQPFYRTFIGTATLSIQTVPVINVLRTIYRNTNAHIIFRENINPLIINKDSICLTSEVESGAVIVT
ncbi:hypothetical protein AAY84_15925 [Serratia marcescens]|nr:hypothetical protein AAY84_15925 [Serratia marcescens]